MEVMCLRSMVKLFIELFLLNFLFSTIGELRCAFWMKSRCMGSASAIAKSFA
jgi:hypothetical protein